MSENNLNLEYLLQFYDGKIDEVKGKDVGKFNTFLGEELGFALLRHYIEHVDKGVFSLTSRKCTTGKRTGPRLDGWIAIENKDGKYHYQIEIKNWNPHSYKRKAIPKNPNWEEYRKEMWSVYFGENNILKGQGTKKVLESMKKHDDVNDKDVRPLLLLWDPLHPKGEAKPFFSVPIKHENFKQIWVFSMSSYVRFLIEEKQTKSIEFEMEEINRQFKLMKNIFVNQ